MQALENACVEIVNVLRNVDGFGQVPLNPPTVVSYSMFAVVYPFSGNVQIGEVGTRMYLHNIAIDILTKDTDLARAIEKVKPFLDTVANALERQVSYDSDGNTGGQFNQSIDTYARFTYSWLQSDYGGVPVIGYHCFMEDVKIRTNL